MWIGDSGFSPVGRWIVANYEHPQGPHWAGGEEPSSLRLYDRMGRFVRDLTFPRFYYVLSFWWKPLQRTQRSELIFASTDFNTEGGFWRCDPQTGNLSPLSSTESAPYSSNQMTLDQWSPTGDKCLLEAESPGLLNESILYCDQTTSRNQRKLAESDGPGVYSPDGRWVLFRKSVLTPSDTQPMTDEAIADELWTVKTDGKGAACWMDWNQEQRFVSQHQWRDAQITNPIGWCGAKTVLASGGVTTAKGVVNGLWIVRPGGNIHFVPGPDLLAASQGGRAFILQDKTEVYLMTLPAGSVKHTSSMRRPAKVAPKYRVSQIVLPAGTPVPDFFAVPIRSKPFYARLRGRMARLHIPAKVTFLDGGAGSIARVRNVAAVSIYDMNIRRQAVGSVSSSPF